MRQHASSRETRRDEERTELGLEFLDGQVVHGNACTALSEHIKRGSLFLGQR
jgi:hypothetical protein